MSQQQRDKHLQKHAHDVRLRKIIDPFLYDLNDIIDRECVQLRSGSIIIPDTIPNSHSLVVCMCVVETKHAHILEQDLNTVATRKMTEFYGEVAAELNKIPDSQGTA